jgi:hypothetical protein
MAPHRKWQVANKPKDGFSLFLESRPTRIDFTYKQMPLKNLNAAYYYMKDATASSPRAGCFGDPVQRRVMPL